MAAVQSGKYKFIRLNYPNGDMVGHTGIPAAIRVAVECVDLGLSRIAPAVEKAKGVLMVTADHGNADVLFTEKNGKRSTHVAHSLNPVPFIVKDYSGADSWQPSGVEGPGLSNVAATICNILGYEAPEGYAPSLVSLR